MSHFEFSSTFTLDIKTIVKTMWFYGRLGVGQKAAQNYLHNCDVGQFLELEINGNSWNGWQAKAVKRKAGDGHRTRDVQLGNLGVDWK